MKEESKEVVAVQEIYAVVKIAAKMKQGIQKILGGPGAIFTLSGCQVKYSDC